MKHLESPDFLSPRVNGIISGWILWSSPHPSVMTTAGLICSFQTVRTFPNAVIYKPVVLYQDNGLEWHYVTAEQIRLCPLSSVVTHATIAHTRRYVRLDNVLLHHSGGMRLTIISHGYEVLRIYLCTAAYWISFLLKKGLCTSWQAWKENTCPDARLWTEGLVLLLSPWAQQVTLCNPVQSLLPHGH